MKIKIYAFALITGLLFSSCSKEDTASPELETTNSQSSVVPKDIIQKLKALNFSTDGVEKREVTRPDGSSVTSFLVEGDILLSESQINKMSDVGITDKQYRTYNLVSTPKTIRVLGFTAQSNQGLTEKQKQALVLAVENYNDLDINLDFTLSFGTNTANADIIIFQAPGAAGGVAGFPSNGNPYQFVQIFSGMEQFSLSVNEHVITHEIGHTLGMRHSDWFTRESCGRPSFGELANPSGSVHIPGTPYRYDPNSIMASCFSSSETGNFGQFDVVAFEYLY